MGKKQKKYIEIWKSEKRGAFHPPFEAGKGLQMLKIKERIKINLHYLSGCLDNLCGFPDKPTNCLDCLPDCLEVYY